MDLSGYFCSRPFSLMEIHGDLEAFACCPDWLPVKLGNMETNNLMEVWNALPIQEIRRSILEGDYSYCDKLRCPYISGRGLEKVEKVSQPYKDIIAEKRVVLEAPPLEIALCYDLTCNLSCPSCRKSKIVLRSGSEFEKKRVFTEKILDFLETHGRSQRIILRVSGSGEPLASPLFLQLLTRLDANQLPLLELILQTNGTLFTPRLWQQLSKAKRAIQYLSISIDAASEATYRKVRRGGNWNRLQENLAFIAELKKRGEILLVSFNFVVQNENFFEMADFVRWAQSLGVVNEIFFTPVFDLKTWSKEEFDRQCIWNPDHPHYPQLLEVLKDPIFDSPKVFLANLSDIREQALKKSTHKAILSQSELSKSL
ncbi:MAG: radical SAM protein [Bdellovibrionales bacterium]|nr:radical SAM protein [Bdellovibrionales bacterium]